MSTLRYIHDSYSCRQIRIMMLRPIKVPEPRQCHVSGDVRKALQGENQAVELLLPGHGDTCVGCLLVCM
jgi:hypothetical protein